MVPPNTACDEGNGRLVRERIEEGVVGQEEDPQCLIEIGGGEGVDPQCPHLPGHMLAGEA